MTKRNANPATLRRLLQEELQVSKVLLVLAEQQTDVLVANDVPGLKRLQAEQQRCIDRRRVLEQERIAAVRELAWEAGLDRVPTLKNLLPALPAREQEAMERLRQQLLKVHADLGRVHKRNRGLLESALNYVRFSLHSLTSAALKPARYGTNLNRLTAPAFYIDSKA